MKILIRICVLMFCSVQLLNAQTKKVLFIGNSYTFFNDMPEMVEAAANSTGDDVSVTESTVGGSDIEFHATSTYTQNNISADDWDFVSIQGNSVEVAVTGDYFDVNVYPFAAQLVDKIRTNNACSQPVFYRTWGRENGIGGTTCTNYPTLCSYESMNETLASNYKLLADDNDGLISPVGAVWDYLIENPDTPDLYNADESHPSVMGSYVAACTFYTIILRKDPTLISYDAGIDATVAEQIRAATKTVVFDQLATWKVGEFDPVAAFSASANAAEITFTNMATNADSYTWDFGDGTMSTDENPVHTYSQIGMFDVVLEVTRCGQTDTFQSTININALDVKPAVWQQLNVYPNPVKETVHIEGVPLHNIAVYEVFDIQGKRLKTNEKTIGMQLNVSHLKSGTYFLKIQLKTGESTTRRLIKE